jgi:hypothetical protein
MTNIPLHDLDVSEQPSVGPTLTWYQPLPCQSKGISLADRNVPIYLRPADHMRKSLSEMKS